MDFGQNRTITTACLSGALLCLAATLALGNGAFAAIAAIFFFLTLLIWKYGYWIVPFFTRGLNIIEIRGGHEIPPSQDVVLKKTKSGYIATMFLGISVNESSGGKSEQQKAIMMDLFERALSSLRCVTKICMMVDNIDLSDYIDQLKERRGLSETRLSQLQGRHGKAAEVARLEREIAYYSRQIEKLGTGERPMQVVAYAMTSADGLTREEALSRVRAQSGQVIAVLSNALGASVFPLSGDGMRRCFDWEFSIPTSPASLSDQLF